MKNKEQNTRNEYSDLDRSMAKMSSMSTLEMSDECKSTLISELRSKLKKLRNKNRSLDELEKQFNQMNARFSG